MSSCMTHAEPTMCVHECSPQWLSTGAKSKQPGIINAYAPCARHTVLLERLPSWCGFDVWHGINKCIQVCAIPSSYACDLKHGLPFCPSTLLLAGIAKRAMQIRVTGILPNPSHFSERKTTHGCCGHRRLLNPPSARQSA